MRYLYSLVLYLISPLILLRLIWRAHKNSAHLKHLPERFGFINKKIIPNGVWVHAVSVGEVVAAAPMIKALQKLHPQMPMVVTTTTLTGAERARVAFAGTATHIYLPYDFPGAVNRFLKKIKPRLCILVETELWPNLLHGCQVNKIPVVLANARLSARSAAAYLRFAKLSKVMTQNLALVITQTQADADRFMTLGVNPAKIKVTGSIKFDLEIPTDIVDKSKILRQVWGNERLVWIAASTHEGEEALVLQAFAEVKNKLSQVLLVLVPRHPERFQSVAELCRKQNYSVVMRSENKTCTANTDIFIGDTMGELLLFYAASDLAYVGGSLVKKGGQNPLEPAAIGLPVLTGPYLFNFALINEQLQAINAAVQIDSPQQLAKQVIELLQNQTKRQQMGEQGRKFVANNRGALMRQLTFIQSFLV